MTDLFTVPEFKEHEGIVSSAYDALISSLATRTTAHFERVLHRKFEAPAATYTEDYSGEGRRELVLRYNPVVTLTSVAVDATRQFTTTLSPDEYVVDKEAGILTRVKLSSIPRLLQLEHYWPRGSYNIRVIYDAGWTAIPEDLTEAAILWASRRFNRRGGVGIQSETIGSHSISFASGGTDPDILEMIAPFKSYPALGPVRDAS